MSFSRQYLDETAQIAAALDAEEIELLVDTLAAVRERRGRLFFVGLGGGAAYASHAASDFQRLAGFDTYVLTDSAAQLTATANDEGWRLIFVNWLEHHHASSNDAIFVFSVGGGSVSPEVSAPLVALLHSAPLVTILGVVGRDGGRLAETADACVMIPTVNAAAVTAHTEGFQAVIWHLLVSHPLLKRANPKWESLA